MLTVLNSQLFVLADYQLRMVAVPASSLRRLFFFVQLTLQWAVPVEVLDSLDTGG